ncbi:MAG: glycerol-3-phosphate acyltransferase [Oscillospiraceae bacterium]|nr:glycerol-3-phosphate acyltransferase [Oscillospiraceae bacterium]
MWYPMFIIVLAGYMLGNLNGAVLVSAIFANEDVRKHGSGNAGLTNYIRNYGAATGTLVIVIDGLKAIVACLVGKLILGDDPLLGGTLGGMGVMLGHIFPAMLGFRGGKGILSGFCVAMTLDWRIGLMILAFFLVFYLSTQYVSLGSIMGAAGFAIAFPIFHHDNLPVAIIGFCLGALAVYMHRTNIVRLVKGQERKTNLFAKGKQ